jgi:hypothetical protein
LAARLNKRWACAERKRTAYVPMTSAATVGRSAVVKTKRLRIEITVAKKPEA